MACTGTANNLGRRSDKPPQDTCCFQMHTRCRQRCLDAVVKGCSTAEDMPRIIGIQLPAEASAAVRSGEEPSATAMLATARTAPQWHTNRTSSPYMQIS